MPDLVFMDIELADGLSFKIFDEINITCPIIFTTAYDDYWQEAFEHNSLDYLLKPIRQEKLATALAKYQGLKKYFAQNIQQLLLSQKAPGNGLRKRFLVKRGVDYISIKIEEIAYFYAMHKVVCLVDTKGNKFILDLYRIPKGKLIPGFFTGLTESILFISMLSKKLNPIPKVKFNWNWIRLLLRKSSLARRMLLHSKTGWLNKNPG